MTIGEIKLDTLSLMNVCNDNKLELSFYNTYLNESKYKKYLVNMDEPLKRAVDIINSKNILKSKSIKLSELNHSMHIDNKYTKKGYIIVGNSQITDFNEVKKIFRLSHTGIEKLKYETFSDKIVIYISGAYYDDIYIEYYPKVVIPEFDVTTRLDIPDSLARLIPYYIKYDLYQEDEPNLAYLARTNFDTLLESYIKAHESEESEIIKVFEV